MTNKPGRPTGLPYRKYDPTDKKESDVKRKIRNWCTVQGILAVPISNTGIFDDKIRGKFRKAAMVGISDIFLCYKGFFIAVEVKFKSGTLNQNQIVFLHKVRKAGGYTIVPYSVDMFIYLFNEIKSEIDGRMRNE